MKNIRCEIKNINNGICYICSKQLNKERVYILNNYTICSKCYLYNDIKYIHDLINK